MTILFSCRHGQVQEWLRKIESLEGGMEAFSQGYKYYGLQFQPDNSVIVREWAPGAKDVYITGDFSEYFCCLVSGTRLGVVEVGQTRSM